MSLRDAAAERRARIRALLRSRTQEEPLLTAKRLLQLLGSPPGLDVRVVQQDVQAIRRLRASSNENLRLTMVPIIPAAKESRLNGEA